MITTIPRYNKNQLIFVNDKEITLIDYLKELRIKNKITKKRISNLIKDNNTWYSQVERDGKNGDDNRQKTIYRDDLIDVISIVKFGANSYKDLHKYKSQSKDYLDDILRPIAVDNSLRVLKGYELMARSLRTIKEQDKLFEKLLNSIKDLLIKAFKNEYIALDYISKCQFLNNLTNLNITLKTNPAFLIYLITLPYAEFLYSENNDEIFEMLRDIVKILDHTDKNIDIKDGYELIEYIRAKYLNGNLVTRNKNEKTTTVTYNEYSELFDKIYPDDDQTDNDH